MKKRIEKVVECIDDDNGVIYPYPKMCINIGEKYVVTLENDKYYSLLNDDGVIYPYPRRCFTVVSEREVLEFDGFNLDKWNNVECHLEFTSDIDLKKYDFKIIATPKDSPYEGKSREELIEIIKELKLKK